MELALFFVFSIIVIGVIVFLKPTVDNGTMNEPPIFGRIASPPCCAASWH